MANVVIGAVEHTVEDVLHWLAGAKSVLLHGPTILTALMVLLTAVDKVVNDTALDVTAPTTILNIPIAAQQLQDVKAVWSDLKSVFAAAGFKI